MIEKGLSKLSSKLTFNKVFSDWRRDIELCQVAKAIQALASSKKSPTKPVELSTINTSQDGGTASLTPAPSSTTTTAALINPIPTTSSQHQQS